MSVYLQGHGDSVLRSHRWRTAQNSAAYLLPHLRPGMTLVDVGCGPGTITRDLAAVVGPAGSVIGIDASAGVLEEARSAAGSGNVTFTVGDAHDLPLPDDCVDVAHAHQTLQHVHDPVGALREMSRVVTSDGLIAVRDADYEAMTWWPDVPGLRLWRDTYRQVARLTGGEPDAGRRLLAWARQAELVDVRPSASTWCYADDDDRAWWGGLQAERITSTDVAGHILRAGILDEDDLHTIADAWRTWAASPDAWFAVLHGEVLARPAQAAS